MTPLFSANFNALSRDIDRGDHREYWLKGGRGSGKSTFIALQIVLGIVEHAGANAVIYRKVAATLRDSVYDQIIRAINRLGVAPFFEYRLSPLEIRYKPTGQRILFRGADDPGKSKSITLREGYFGYLWFEELTDFKNVEEIRTIRASVIRGAAERRTVTFCSYNPPKSAQSWVNAEALAPAEGRLVHSSDYRQLPPEWLGEDFIADAEALKATNEAAYRHMYLGEITGTGGQVFDNLQLREIIRNKIDDGEYMPGTAIPSENKLAETFGINRITIRNAVDALVNEGLLRRVQGKGVFVVGKKNELSIEEHAGFVGDAIRSDSRVSIKELQKSEREAGNKYANLFGLELEDEIYYIRQMHSLNGVETSIEEFFMPKKILPSLDSINSSVFTFRDILSFYGIKLEKMTQTLRIIKGSAKVRKLLNVPEGVAIFLLECDFYNEKNEVIAHSISNIRSDMQSFSVSLHK